MLAAAPSWVTSPLTLNIVTALGTLLAGIGAILVLLAAGPRYRLRYGPLKSRPDGEKWKANIYLASRGRRFCHCAREQLQAIKTALGRIGPWWRRWPGHHAEQAPLLL